MKKFWIRWMVALLAGVSVAEKPMPVVVTGDRVSLRAAPALNAVLLDQAMLGDSLDLLDNSNADWVGVRAPDHIKLWVSREFVENETVLPALLNIRSGSSMSHEVVGIAKRGDVLTIRSMLEDWLCIAPTSNSTVWISRPFTNVKKPTTVATYISPEDSPPEPEVTNDVPLKIDQVFVETAKVVDLPSVLEPDPTKEQGMDCLFSGILTPVGKKLWQLVDPALPEKVVCYVRGNQKQMDSFSGRFLFLTGETYWAVNLPEPIMVPSKIEVRKTLPSQ